MPINVYIYVNIIEVCKLIQQCYVYLSGYVRPMYKDKFCAYMNLYVSRKAILFTFSWSMFSVTLLRHPNSDILHNYIQIPKCYTL
jgi:hypothetical protein